jgi:hypothetical protein
LKHRTRAYFTAIARQKRRGITKRKHVRLRVLFVDGGEVGDEGEKSLEDLELYVERPVF